MDYYADQKPSALLRAKAFRDERAPKFLNHFERVLKKSGSGWLLPEGGATYADLVLFQMIEGVSRSSLPCSTLEGASCPSLDQRHAISCIS